MKVDPGRFATGAHAIISADGSVAELRIERANGSISLVQLPAEKAGAFLPCIEQSVGTVIEKQRQILGGNDPRTFFPVSAKRVSKFQAGTALEGTPIVSIELESGARLDLALHETQLHEWIGRLEA